MSYQVLARKWRPRDFSTLVGQEHVVKALTHALDQKRLHHAWLFTGTRGVGKTTISRILAKSLNCRGADGQGDITSQPCGVCQACTEIDAGRFVDYIELDAASNRGVDEIAQLLEQAVYAPSSGRFKVYMIDEVHMLTNHAFNAMLKTLEEPPPHVKFILATTDPQKIPVTVLSRCLQFNLKQMPAAQTVEHLSAVLQAEQIPFEPGALRLLAKAANGSMRDALSLTDQAIAYSGGEVGEAAVRNMLGALDQTYLVRLLDALAASDGPGLLTIADEMAERSLSFSAALQDLAALLHKIALAQAVPAAIPDEWPETPDIRRLAGALDAQEVQLYYQIANLGRQDLPLAPDEAAGFGMTLLRMLAFRPKDLGGAAQQATPPRAAALAAAPAAASMSKAPARPAPDVRTPNVQAPDMQAPRQAGQKPAAASSPRAAYAAAMGAEARVASPPNAAPRRAAPLSDADAVNLAAAQAAAEEAAEERAPAPRFSQAAQPARQSAQSAQPPAQSSAQSSTQSAQPAQVSQPMRAAQRAPSPEGLPDVASWPALAASLPLKGLSQQLAMQTELLRAELLGNGEALLHLVSPVKQAGEGSSLERLQAALSAKLGRTVKVSLSNGEVQATAAVVDAEARAQRQAQAEQAVGADPMVQALMRDFGATIVPGSIRPGS
ncbi:MAG: DNA polymerase III subunit gamma/tau [Candidatus Protistobacter heckmanni]|nr:DNA polymerase III subunit gamma/tau [Candidatus Protistobacter heckmanni]